MAGVPPVFVAGSSTTVSGSWEGVVTVSDSTPGTRLTRTFCETTGTRGSVTLSGSRSTCPKRNCVGSVTAFKLANARLSSP